MTNNKSINLQKAVVLSLKRMILIMIEKEKNGNFHQRRRRRNMKLLRRNKLELNSLHRKNIHKYTQIHKYNDKI